VSPSHHHPSKHLIKAFDSAPAEDRALIQLLSIIYAPVSRHVLLNTARLAGLHASENRPYTGLILGETLARLEVVRVVKSSKDGVRCNTLLAHHATLSAVKEGTFATMAQAVQGEIPMVSNWGSSYYRSALHALRDVRIGLYRKDMAYVMQIAALYERQFPYDTLRCHPLISASNNPFDPDWFRSFPEPLQIAVLRQLLPYARLNLLDSEGPFQILTEMYSRQTLPQDLVDNFALELLLRGRLHEAEQVAGEMASSTQMGILACGSLFRGHYHVAVERFESGLIKLRKETGKRKSFFDDLTGPLYILALIASGDTEFLLDASEYCSFVTAKKEWPHQDVYRTLQLVIRERNGEHGITELLESQYSRLSGSAFYKLFLALALYWLASKQAETVARQLHELAQQLRESGDHWLADELILTATASGVEHAADREVQERYEIKGLLPLWQCLRRTESWDNALTALLRLNKPEEAPPRKEALQSRLIWHFEESRTYFDIHPREQKQTASGKWSAGRNVSLKRLAEEADSLDFLTGQDRLICGCIKLERGHGYYNRDSYQLNLEQALPLMIGHPHVYLDPAGSTRLELVRGEPELQLVTEGDTLKLHIYPPFEQERKIYLQKESPTRLKIFEAKEEYKKIAAILGTGLKLPSHARHKALEAIQSLSSIMPVHSDIGSESAETVNADPTPCFHLLPYGAGLKVELLVRPFGDAGPYFRPGAGGETVMAEIEGKRVQAKRDLRVEVRRAYDAVAALPALPEGDESDNEWLVPATDTALELLLQFQELGDKARVAWPQGAKFKVRQEATTQNLRLSIRHSKEWFELEGEVKLNQGLALDLQKLVEMAKDTPGRFIDLGDGDFIALSSRLRKRLEELTAYAEPHGKGFRVHPLTAGALEEFAGEVGGFKADLHWQKQLQRVHEAQAFQPVVPSTLQAELRSYQEEGFIWLNRLAHWGVGACLADDMGLGKTVQALAQILTMAADGPSLVVAPTSVCMNWESETLKFAPTLNPVMFGGGNRKETLAGLKPFDLVICSYGLLQLEGELLARVDWQVIVLDEAQAIKNVATKRSQAAMELKGAFKMVATGTPVENHLGELWNVFRFINPGLLGSLKQFNVKFAAPIEKSQDKKARTRLKRLIQPFILRRTKNQVLEELPPRTEILIKVEMSEAEASFYEAVRRSALDNLAGVDKVEGKAQTNMKILAEIMRLRRACCNSRLLIPESKIPSAKLAAFGEIVSELRENRHKALVFSQFVGHLDIIRQYVEKAGIPYQYLDGSTPPAERKKRVDEFQAGIGDLFLISLKAGGTGLNLTAADYVIHMDPWWNPAVEDQASDRAHRMGQQRPVTIYRLVTKGTIEEKIVGLHQQKRGLADSLLEETDLSGRVSAEELLALLRKEQ
jgi:superfamily II DNA or RNA helicase